MKRLAVLALLMFTFLFAPQIPTLRTASAEPAHAEPAHVVELPPELEALLNQSMPTPAVVCVSSASSPKCVPHYRFNDEVNVASVHSAMAWIDAANEAGAEEILFEINSPGGSVSDGFELIKAIENSEAPVTCVVDGDAESMGAAILEGCDHRAMTKRSKLMFHEPALGGMLQGQPNQWAAIAAMMKAEAEILAEHCAHLMKISLKEYNAHVVGSQMWFLTHREAMKVGAVDEVVVSVRSLQKRMETSKTITPKQE